MSTVQMERPCDGEEHLREVEVEASLLVIRSVDNYRQISKKKIHNQSSRRGLRSGFHLAKREQKQAGPVVAYAEAHPISYPRMDDVGG